MRATGTDRSALPSLTRDTVLTQMRDGILTAVPAVCGGHDGVTAHAIVVCDPKAPASTDRAHRNTGRMR